MKPIYKEKGRVLIKIEKTITKEKTFNPETKKFESVDKVDIGNTGTVLSATDSSFKKGEKVMFNLYGALQVKDDKKYVIIVNDYEDINVIL